MYAQVTKEDRKAIEYYLKCSWTLVRIGQILGKDTGTIWREVHRNRCPDGVYRYGAAHSRALERRKKAKFPQCKLQNSPALRKKVEQKLQKLDSPEQIAGVLRRKGILLSHETIYRWIYTERTDLQCFLRCQKGKWKRKRGTKKRAKQRRIQQFRCISTRPALVEERKHIGDWEGDTLIGQERKQRILSYVERKSGFACAAVVRKVSSESIQETSVRLFADISPSKKRTITFDRGMEFGGEDALFEKRTGMTIFRAHPYHSWERGTNENWNGLLRQFFPKGTNFSTITQDDVARAVHNLNHRPRKRLNYLSPYEVFVLGLDPKYALQT